LAFLVKYYFLVRMRHYVRQKTAFQLVADTLIHFLYMSCFSQNPYFRNAVPWSLMSCCDACNSYWQNLQFPDLVRSERWWPWLLWKL